MDFSFSEEQTLFANSIGKYLDGNYGFEAYRAQGVAPGRLPATTR